MNSTEIEKMKDRMRQQARAGLPFNPVSSLFITGANVQRLQKSMDSFGWTDHRFISASQAKANGWVISDDAEKVTISERDEKSGAVSQYSLFNASSVLGMPTLAEMLQMDDEAFLAMRGIAPAELAAQTKDQISTVEAGNSVAEEISPDAEMDAPRPSQETSVETDDFDVEVGPALSKDLETAADIEQIPSEEKAHPAAKDLFLDELVQQLDPPTFEHAGEEIDWSEEPSSEIDEFVVSAPYWLDGLHNFEGLKLADEINRLIQEKKLGIKKEGVSDLLATYPDKLKYGLNVIEKNKNEKDPLRKANLAEPKTLLHGALVRDKEGKYRPKEGGLPIIEDKGTSLKLKRKNGKAYEAAMELALAKGWKAIELNGKPKMLGQAWLEAKMKGLEVVNYTPTEKDREALAQRMAERDAAIAKDQGNETVELRPVIDSDGREVMAKVTTTVEQENKPIGEEALASGNIAQRSTLTRSTTRLNDVVRTDVQPGTVPKGSRAARNTKDIVQREIAEAVAEEKVEEVSSFDMKKGGILVEQGTAPYNHNPNFKSSPYAVLVNDEGISHTFWGQDLPRSIKSSGAVIGDKISLIAGERTPVTVPVTQNDGTERAEVFNRVTWNTEVLSKSPAVETPDPKDLQAVDQGLHIGRVMEIKNGMIAQKTGRNPDNVVWHSISNLGGKVPEVGEIAEIGYTNGQGKVLNKEMERGVSR